MKIPFQLEGLPKRGAYFGYEDYRLDAPERGLFYVGIGDRKRVRVPERPHNRGHRNIAACHGVLRKIVRVFLSVDEMNSWEIRRIREIRESGATLVNKTDGGEGTRGVMPVRNPETGETCVMRITEIPLGWTHSSSGMVPCRNQKTGETTNFPSGKIPEGWVPTADGMMSFRNIRTGEVKRMRTDSIPDGWVGLNKGRATFRNQISGETRMFDVESVPNGWIHIAVGTVMCRNLNTGETKVFLKGNVPEGWAGVTKGLVACKNLTTGEKRSFPIDSVPDGWVGVALGTRKTGSIDQQIKAIAESNPNISRQELMSICVAQGINKASAQHSCWRMKLGLVDPNPFQKWIEILSSFIAKNGRLPLASDLYMGARIGAWCSAQRSFYKNGKLSHERIRVLEEMPDWCWSKLKSRNTPLHDNPEDPIAS